MANTVSFGVVTSGNALQSKPVNSGSLPTIVHSTVVGRRTFGSISKNLSSDTPHVGITRRRSSAK